MVLVYSPKDDPRIKSINSKKMRMQQSYHTQGISAFCRGPPPPLKHLRS
jgi:hypothetical protein